MPMGEKSVNTGDKVSKSDEIKLQEEKIKELELQLRVEQRKYQIIADYSNCGLWEYDIATHKYSQSRKLEGKWSTSNLNIENYRETVKSWGLIHPEDIAIFDAYCDSMDRGDAEFEYDLRAASDAARFIWLRYIGGAIYDFNQNPIKIVGKTLDVTKEKTEYAALVKKTTHDPLTQLYNNEATREIVEESLVKADFKGSGKVLYIIDIDNFKVMNERWGHLYGDSVLERFADTLLAFFSADDVVGRIGGDEFLVLCHSGINEEQAKLLAESFKYRVHSLDLKDGEHVSVSIGITMFPKHAKTYDALFRSAEIALFHAKKNGKDGYVMFNKHMSRDSSIGESIQKIEMSPIINIVPKEMNNIDKELFDYSFETICAAENFSEALRMILSEIGIYFHLGHILVLEYNYGLLKAFITESWSHHEGIHAKEEIEHNYTKSWRELERCFYRQNCILYNSEQKAECNERISQLFEKNHIKAAIQFPIFDGNQLVGILSFEDENTKREWSTTETATLSSITKMISSFLLRIRSKQELEEENLYTGSAMDSQKLMYYSIDANTYELMYISRYANELFPKIRLGNICYKSMMGLKQPCKDCPIHGLKDGLKQFAIELFHEKRDTWFTVSASIIEKNLKQPQYLLCWMDITMFLKRVKSTDQLTGTLSYDKFRAEALKYLSSSHNNQGYATAFLGIRNFSDVNEHYGYEVGDLVLQALAKQFMNALSKEELICRIKGDDFIMFLKNDDIQGVKDRLSILCKSFHIQIRDKYPFMALRCDCGVYEVKPSDYSISAILDKANLARKQAMEYSHEWDSITILTEEAQRRENEEKVMERMMVEALHRKEYQVFLHPKVEVTSGRIVGAEALVRWVNEEKQMISPTKFIPLAEKNGFVTEIDKYVYELLFQQLHEWIQKGYKIPLISFNVSRLHLFDEKFVEYLQALVERYQIPYELLEIEITESVFIDNMDRLIDMIDRLRTLGFTVSMDDFGTGFSTLSLMKSLPIDVLKLDGNFFYHNRLDRKSKAIISSIIHLAKNLGIQVVAEGVETLEQVIFIQEQNCDYAQGYYYYRPLPMKEFEVVLWKNKNTKV